MDDNSAELPFLSNIGLTLTYKCTVACPHCIVEAGPHRTEEIPLKQCLNLIDQARAYRFGHLKGIALTGGEPFYNRKNLSHISAHGKSLGFTISAVTSAYWATSKNEALNVLSALPAIQMISISTDVYHQKMIPFEYVKNAIWAAKRLDRLYNIAVCTDDETDEKFKGIIKELEAIGESDKIRISLTYPVGREKKRAHCLNYKETSEPTVSACAMASSPVVFPDGKVSACIGPILTLPSNHPLYLGNINQETLSEILDRSEINPLLHIIRVWGPQMIVSLLRDNNLQQILPEKYMANSICDVCYKLLSDKQIVNALDTILQDEQLRYKIAYARLYYLHEKTMAEKYRLYD
jgi:MoaA/NifB/PqqE/SkfB family radical SAM enzyme